MCPSIINQQHLKKLWCTHLQSTLLYYSQYLESCNKTSQYFLNLKLLRKLPKYCRITNDVFGQDPLAPSGGGSWAYAAQSQIFNNASESSI